MAERPSVFQGVSSLPGDFDGTIGNARFGKNPKYTIKSGPQAGQMPVVFSFDIDSPELEDPIDHILTIGNGFKAENNGTLAVREKAGKEGFQDNSNIQLWIDRLFDLDADAMVSRYEQTEYPPQDARFWEGLTCHFDREKYKDFNGNEKDRLMPTALIGWDAVEEPAKKAPAKKATATKKKKAAAPKAEDNGAGEIDPAVLELIDGIADESEDFDSFIAEVFSQVEAAAEEPLYSKVMEGEDVEGSIWQRAVARAEE